MLADRDSPTEALIPVKNRAADLPPLRASQLISTDALALVRFGLRAASDPRIVDTVTVIDHVLRTETDTGPTWRRYNEDGYGEHADGRAFDGTGIGRGWPLLSGERAHYEIAAGRPEEAVRLAAVMRAQASLGGMLPEQVWDAEDIASRELYNGKAAGSAMPLVWAHSEYVKLLRSLHEGNVYDCPPQTHARYVVQQRLPRVSVWRFNFPHGALRQGCVLRLDLHEPARVRWSADDWATCTDTESHEIARGLHVAELPTDALAAGSAVHFTFYWPDAARWEGQNFTMQVEPAT